MAGTRGLSVADIVGSISLQNTSIGDANEQMNTAYDKIKGIQETEAENQKQDALNQATIESAKQSAELKQKADNQTILTQLGTDVSSATSIISRLAPQIQADFDRAEQLDKIISQKESVGFFDNPFEYISNQFTINDDIDQYNQAARSINRKSSYIKEMEDLSQEAMVTTNAAKSAVTEASAAAAVKHAALAATTASNQALIQAQTVEINKINEGLQLKQSQINNRVQARKLIDDEADRKMRIAQFNAEQADRLQRANDRKDIETDKQQMLNFVNAGAIALGKRTFQNTHDLDMYAKSTEGKENFQKLYDIGYQAATSAATGKGSVVIAATPAEAGDFLTGIRGSLAPSMKKVQDLVTRTTIGVKQQTEGYKAPIDLKNKDAVNGAINTRVYQEVEDNARDVTRNTDTNIYSPPTFQSIVATTPDIKNTALFDKVFKQEVAVTTARTLDPQYVLQRTVDAVQKKEVSYKEAMQGLQSLFSSAVETNNIHNGYTRVGLPEQKTFRAPIKTDPNAIYFTDSKTVDLTDPVQLSTVLNKFLVHEILNKNVDITLHNNPQQVLNKLQAEGNK